MNNAVKFDDPYQTDLLPHFKKFDEFKHGYLQRVMDGRSQARDLDITVASITRNNGERIYKNLEIIEKHFCQNFKNYNIFVYENDSTDNTVKELHRYKNDFPDNFEFLSETRKVAHMPLSKSKARTQNLAYCRNLCLENIKNNHRDAKITLIIDSDFLGVDINGLFSSISFLQHDTISGICGHSFIYHKHPKEPESHILTNYDSWAYRQTWWNDYQETMFWFTHWLPFIGSSPIHVNSAFGGACFYVTEIYTQGKYTGEDCEHVTFHQSLNEKFSDFSLVVNPSQLMLMGH